MILGLIQGYQWLIILLIVLLLFGGKKIPELMRGAGRGVRAFKEGMNEAEAEIKKPLSDTKEESKKETSAKEDREG